MGTGKLLKSFFLVLFILCIISCMDNNNYKGNILKNAYVLDNVLYAQLDANNGKIGKITGLYIGKNGSTVGAVGTKFSDGIITVEYVLKSEFTDYIEGEKYDVYVKWYGGGLTADCIYQNGSFKILTERYSNGI